MKFKYDVDNMNSKAGKSAIGHMTSRTSRGPNLPSNINDGLSNPGERANQSLITKYKKTRSKFGEVDDPQDFKSGLNQDNSNSL